MARQALGLEGANGIGFLQRKPDFIQAIDQTVLAERLDIERQFAAVLRNNDLAFQIDAQFVARKALDFIKQPRHLKLRQQDGQQARSEERRAGKECVSTFRSRVRLDHKKKNKKY